jgi:hypothetical protein
MKLQMIRYQTGETRVIDAERMIASEFLAHGDQDAPLADYNLDCTLEPSDLESPYSVVR